MSKNIYQVTFIDQTNGNTHTEHTIAESLTDIENYYADIQNIRVVAENVDDLTTQHTKESEE